MHYKMHCHIHIIVPRFILGLRELYTHDLQGRQGSYIDTAFGFGSGPGHDSVRSGVAFTDLRVNEGNERGDEQSDAVQMDGT